MTTIALDFETYSATDLRKRGLRNYLDDPTFQPLIAATVGTKGARLFDFTLGRPHVLADFKQYMLRAGNIYAHNAEFEYQVLLKMGIEIEPQRFIDTAVMSRCWGGSGSLDGASRQFLTTHKMTAQGSRLIRKFCMPGSYQLNNLSDAFDPQITVDEAADWDLFGAYCLQDTKACWELSLRLPGFIEESALSGATFQMNRVGWPVDLDLVREMQRRYLENLDRIEAGFRSDVKDDPAKPLSLNSHPQQKKWCLERGVRVSSFDKESVATLIPRLEKKLDVLHPTDPKYFKIYDVLKLMRTKQALGGSSLKKLQTVLDTVSSDGRLHNQYIHVGAGQTWRTTGVGVQMQNLKRIGEHALDVEDLVGQHNGWNNDDLAKSLRQCFTSSHPKGMLIVGDFSSVESRGLAYMADEDWKLQAYREGQDLYKVQAAAIYGVQYEQVTKEQRQTGKLGELSCGYGAGKRAITKFAKNMGISMSEVEAEDLKVRWRDANPKTVELWVKLEDCLREAMRTGYASVPLGNGLGLMVGLVSTPDWIKQKNQHAKSYKVTLSTATHIVMLRFFHGVHLRGSDIVYYKPSQGKTGDPWSCYYRDPKSKQVVYYTLYGGKLAGILTQSMCREIFMRSLNLLYSKLDNVGNVSIIGQFHDEIVMDWVPLAQGKGFDFVGLYAAKACMEQAMTDTLLPDFPLAADIKHDYRYTK